ncbi:hypothetical protein [Actinophytocola xanthii]|uniref:Uncharacterized protein n=1 Tax=Actinophytocola xanthii TaxID=1912961 RepID=A0A1Q8CYM2_9PSEU|nr:hypothetical protein [Actinophytocola xanthii]OLF19458.1 hypothetical protein BU204_00590 [Actinophytocola xanthii]
MSEVVTTLARSLRRLWDEGARVERVAIGVGALLMASGLVHLAVLVVSGGTWTGPVSLRKPTTFGLSFGLTLVTVAWVAHLMRLSPRLRGPVLAVFTAACVVETALVSVQAWRGVPSHLNFATGFDSAVSATLAFGGMVLIATAVALTLAALARGGVTPSMRLATQFGFLTLLVALGVGAAMISAGTAAARSDPALAYSAAGFLKLPHAVFMHGVLVIPGLAWLLDLGRYGESVRLRVVGLGAAGYLLVGLVVLVESIARVPLFAAPAPAMAAAGAGLVLLVAAAGIAARGLLIRHPGHPEPTPDAVLPTPPMSQIN